MRTGTLRHSVVLKEFSSVSDEFGGQVLQESMNYTRRCAIRGITGKEIEKIGHLLSEASYRFQFRYDDVTSRITKLWKIVHGSRTYEVLYQIDPDGRGREIVVFAKAVI